MFYTQDDKGLTARIVEGDSAAENYLFSRFSERIKLLVSIRLKGRVSIDDQKDIIGEIYKAVLTSLRKGGYDPERGKPLEAYISGITSNIVGQYFRRQKREAGKIKLNGEMEAPVNILSEIIDNERKEKLKDCLNKIKPKYLEVLILRYYENKTIEEIGEFLNLERRRVSERINYAFKLLLQECRKDKYFQYFTVKDK